MEQTLSEMLNVEEEALKSDVASVAPLIEQSAPHRSAFGFGVGPSVHSSPFGHREAIGLGRQLKTYKSVQSMVLDILADWYSYLDSEGEGSSLPMARSAIKVTAEEDRLFYMGVLKRSSPLSETAHDSKVELMEPKAPLIKQKKQMVIKQKKQMAIQPFLTKVGLELKPWKQAYDHRH
uniref:Uncharacterized protein n=1 Tax=Sphaerodactylus townsendi TaxID=933632 RepID=A0ACB8FQQ1_9SAUR